MIERTLYKAEAKRTTYFVCFLIHDEISYNTLQADDAEEALKKFREDYPGYSIRILSVYPS